MGGYAVQQLPLDHALNAFGKTIDLADRRNDVLDVELGQDRSVGVVARCVELSPVAGNDRTDGKSLLLEEEPHAAGEQHGGNVCCLLRDQEAEREGRVSIDRQVEVEIGVIGIGLQNERNCADQLAGRRRQMVTFPKCGVLPFDERSLLVVQLDLAFRELSLQFEPTILACTPPCPMEGLLHGGGRHTPLLAPQLPRNPTTPPTRVVEGDLADAGDRLSGCRLRVRFVGRRSVSEPLDSICLETPPQLVELRTGHPRETARLGHAAEFLGQLQGVHTSRSSHIAMPVEEPSTASEAVIC